MSERRNYEELIAHAERVVAGIEGPTEREEAFKRVLGSLLIAAPTTSRAEAPLHADPQVLPKAALRKLALDHMSIMYCISASLLLLLVHELVPGDWRLAVARAWAIATLLSVVPLFTLTRQIFNTGIATVLSILALIPIFGYVVLLAIERTAIIKLRRNGISVGLLGAQSNQIPPAT